MRTLKLGMLFAVVASFLSVASLAKDGPFPLVSAVGTWKIVGVQNESTFTITTGRRQGNDVEVYLTIRSANGSVYARGRTLHNLASSRLEVSLMSRDGSMQVVIRQARGDEMGSASRRGLKLVLSFQTISRGQVSAQKSVLLGKILN